MVGLLLCALSPASTLLLADKVFDAIRECRATRAMSSSLFLKGIRLKGERFGGDPYTQAAPHGGFLPIADTLPL